jgi:flagellar motor switch protein FliN/FliY
MDGEPKERLTLDALLEVVPSGSSSAQSARSAFGRVEAAEGPGASTLGGPRQDLLEGIHLKVRVELGRSRLLLKDALRLGPGSIVDLERLVDDPVDIYVGDLRIARGEVLVVNDSFCVRVTEVFSQEGEEES